MIRYVVRKEDENTVKTFCMWLAKDTDWCHRDFYESWRILRKVHEPKISREHKFREVAKILDAAMFEYIINDYTPNIDLQSALKKYLTTGDVETVIGEIREGKHMENTQTRETSQQDLRLRAQQEKGKLAFFLCLFFQFLYSAKELSYLVAAESKTIQSLFEIQVFFSHLPDLLLYACMHADASKTHRKPIFCCNLLTISSSSISHSSL